MQIDYIRREMNDAITTASGGYIQLVGKNTIGLGESIMEAIESLYITGQSSEVKGNFIGVLTSIFAGIQRDGHPRSLGGLLTFYPTCNGPIDLDTGWNPLVNSVGLGVRILNEVDIDITNWVLHDVTPGRQSFSFESITDGTVDGRITPSIATCINGKNIPSADKLRVHVDCEDKSFDIPGTGFTSKVTRIDIPASSLSQLDAPAYKGKTVKFTVRGCYTMKEISAIVNIEDPTLTKVTAEGQSGIIKGQPIVAVGTHLGTGTYKAKWTQGGTAHEAALTATEVTSTQLKFAALADLASVDDNTEITVEVTINGVTVSKASPLYPCVPLAESSDGKVRVYTLTPATGSDLVVGETQNMRGNWLGWDEATQTGTWKATDTMPDETDYLYALNSAELGSNLRVLSAGSEPLIGVDPGTYEVVTTLYRKENGVEVEPLRFTTTKVVREA